MASSPAAQNIKIELNAAIVAVAGGEPVVLVDAQRALPSGPFASEHKTLSQGLRDWALAAGGQPLGYVEQLYTFADRDRTGGGQRLVSIGYLALVPEALTHAQAVWSPWYRHFPWEDHRHGAPSMIHDELLPRLHVWAEAGSGAEVKRARAARIAVAFPDDARRWNDELVLQRYELLWEAGLLQEAGGDAPKTTGLAMPHDHRRILATAMARLRAKIKYRPVVFELMPERFTLLHLQMAVEALAGVPLHKQNFRRLVEAQRLVEETGHTASGASGRPAKLFAFRREVLQERAMVGTKLPRSG
jgi:hypothetical protein